MTICTGLLSDEDFLRFAVRAVPEANAAASLADSIEVDELDGNINQVRRIRFCIASGTIFTCIVKHVPAGGALARFPSLVFPDDRLDYERRWNEYVSSRKDERKGAFLDIRTPLVYFHDPIRRILILEDMGTASLADVSPEGRTFNTSIVKLGHFLGALHQEQSEKKSRVSNPSAERNREFVFRFHLDHWEKVQEIWKGRKVTELVRVRDRVKDQEDFLSRCASELRPHLSSLREEFRSSDYSAFTHGDLHTGSLIITADGLAIIDSELCDYGAAAFDTGTVAAHIIAQSLGWSSSLDKAKRKACMLLRAYAGHFHGCERISRLEQSSMYAGAELLRRLLGPAGFNLELSREKRLLLQDLAYELIVEPGSFVGWLDSH